MRTIPLLLSVLVAAALAVPAAADTCVVGRSDDASLPLGDDRYLAVINEECQLGCLFSVWLIEYRETNGVEGYQRAEDTCGGQVPPDETGAVVF